MATKVKAGPKIIVLLAIIGGSLYGANWYLKNHGDAKMSSVKVEQGQLEEFKETATAPSTGNASITLPGTAPAKLEGAPVRVMILPWNAQMGFLLANGAASTTDGSLMAKNGVKLKIERQDDYGKMKEALISCANELSKGAKTCKVGVNIVSIMGDAAAYFLTGLNETLTKLGNDYRAVIIGSTGRSFGEDKFMGPPECKDDPAKCEGLLVSGVPMDGDWNAALFFAAQNNICNNPDMTTYNPKCLNWVGTSSFTEADEKYIQGACEERPVVRTDEKTGKDKKTGETQKVCVRGVVTWTPGDVDVTKRKGGLVSLISTKENSSQMPQVLISIHKWNQANRKTVVSLLKAALEGGDMVKRSQQALNKAGAISAKVYGEQDAAYWVKYYRGVTETDATKELQVPLGGSSVFNLADNLRYYGLEEGAANAFEATYTTFGNYVKVNYPKELPSFPPASEVVDLSYLKELAASGESGGVADETNFGEAVATDTLAKKAWSITFETGKATFTKDAKATLESLLKTLVIAGDTMVEIHGHTDNAGSAEKNMTLSEARAEAVKKWLRQQAPANFKEGRVTTAGHGQESPVADNSTAAGKAKNRRVEIILKSTR